MKNICRSLCFVLTFVMIFSAIPVLNLFADDVAIAYAFENATAGDGEGTITVSGLSGSGYCSLYFANDTALLSDYEAIASIKESGSSTTLTLPRAFLLPAEATKIVAVETDKAPTSTPAFSAACAEYTLPTGKALPITAPSLTFASVSDAHLNYDDNGYGASAKWTNALDFFYSMCIDYVILSGDITSSGGTTDYERYAAATAKSDFPAENIYEAQGNHDATQVATFLSYTSGAGENHPFEGSAWFSVLFEGENGARDSLFIFMAQELTSTSGTPTTDNFSTKQLDWVEGLLETYAGTETNIFIVEHAMMHNFGPGDKYDGVYVEPMYFKNAYPGNIRFKSLLTEYKEAILMTGHTHLSLYEGYNFGDENGTAARMIHNSSTSQPRSYTSSGSISYNSEGRTNETKGSEGYLVYVYDDAVCYVGYNLSTYDAIPTASYLIPLYSEKRSDAVSIEVTKQPDKLVYESGEWFDGAGMVVTATYGDNSTAVVKGWGCSNVGELAVTDTQVQITYGNCAPVSVSITVNEKNQNYFEGEGTVESPYLISTPEDFALLTELFKTSTDSSEPFGQGQFFVQTADIDMTGYDGYKGVQTDGNGKRYFGGIYDGGGHTLTVNIAVDEAVQTAVFPYIAGVILNLKFKGSITSGTSAQPIRTIQAGAVIANVVVEMTLTSSNANGVCYTQYGTLYNVYVTGVGTKAVYTTNSGGKYYNVFTNMKKASGSELTHSTTTASSDLDAIAAAFNDREGSAYTAGINALAFNNSELGDEALGEVTVKDGALVLSGGKIGGGGVVLPVIPGGGTKDDPYLIGTPEAFKLMTDYFNASTSSSAPYGKGEYFLQTADIDMTGVEGYEGTHANGNAKCYFGGVYDGGGHTLTVNLEYTESSGQTSVFPYIYGAILNLKVTGSITSPESAQPIRTIQAGAVVANCVFEMTLNAKYANGVVYSNYATLLNVYVTGVGTKAVYQSNSSGNYYHVFTNMKNTSGSALTHSTTTASNDLDAIAAAFNNREDAAYTSGVEKLTAVDASLTADALMPVHKDGDKIVFGAAPLPGDINKDGKLNITDVAELLNYLATSDASDLFYDVDGDGSVNISDVAKLLDILSTLQ